MYEPTESELQRRYHIYSGIEVGRGDILAEVAVVYSPLLKLLHKKGIDYYMVDSFPTLPHKFGGAA